MPENTLRQIPMPLLHWYEQSARRLPWREFSSPYRTLVSEFMLQQTRMEAALPYFDRFIKALPTIRALAEADEQVLLKLWEGLGYYSRARNLQKAARMVVDEYGGELPSSHKDLLRLPGIGPYTAGAIASIAFGIPQPAVDGNVLRVVSRITASKKDIGDPLVRRAMEQSIRKIIPEGRAGDFNQALMELGAIVCLPGEPKCAGCPLADLCRGYKKGVAASLPVKQKKQQRRIVEITVFVLIAEGRLAILRRPKSGLLAGLWGLPSADGFLSQEEAKQKIAQWGLPAAKMSPLPPAKHVFTHIEWRMAGFFANISTIPEAGPFTWASPQDLKDTYALPSAYRAYVHWFMTHPDGP